MTASTGTTHAPRHQRAVRAALAALTVNEIVARHPRSIGIFNAFGIDSCCGGAIAVDDAARRDGADGEALLDALVAAASAP